MGRIIDGRRVCAHRPCEAGREEKDTWRGTEDGAFLTAVRCGLTRRLCEVMKR